jgi:hypothetical protein
MPESAARPIAWRPRVIRWRFPLLFVFLLAVLLLTPLIPRYRLLHVALSLVLLDGLYVSLSAAGFPPRWRWFFVGVWLLDAALLFSGRATGDPAVELALFAASRAAALIVLAACVTGTLRYVLYSPRITLDTIFAAIVAYQLLALAFAVLYHAIISIDPDSFAFSRGAPGDRHEGMLVQLVYFSFVTIATLGYGDIVPGVPLTQMIATVEATLGQFYIAVIIAWLVSVHAARRGGGAV